VFLTGSKTMQQITKDSKLLLTSPEVSIEAQLEYPQNQDNKTLAIICHPHPLYDGTMNNKVVYMLNQSFKQLGAICLRFNFRGVGKSSGSFANGKAEAEDLIWLASWLREKYPEHKLYLAGFSFGAFVVAKAYEKINPQAMLLVAPPVKNFDFSDVFLRDLPTMVVQGAKDKVVDPDDVKAWIRVQKYPPTLHWMETAEHFFHGHLPELRSAVYDWLAEDKI